MPRLHGVKERRHQPFWDSLIRTTGDPSPTVPQSKNLFGNANVGDLGLTNLQVPGQLASDQTFAILAMRVYLFFRGTNHRKNYLGTSSQLFFTLSVGDKPQFQAPCWYFPAGGGIYGFDTTSGNSVLNHGVPGQTEIMKLGRPILVPVRQNFQVKAEWYTVGSTDARSTINSGATDDEKVIMFVIDGLQTRDVQ